MPAIFGLQPSSARGPRGECPTPKRLFDMAASVAPIRTEGFNLAAHILACAVCARRWSMIQRNEHYDLVGFLAVSELDEGDFRVMLLERHVAHCGVCRAARARSSDFEELEPIRSVHWSNTVSWLSQGSLENIRRGPGDKIEAVVLDAQGRPETRGDQFDRVILKIDRAEVDETGQLVLRLSDLPTWCRSVRISILSGTLRGVTVRVTPQGGRAVLTVESGVRGAAFRLPLSEIAAWVQRWNT